MNSILTDRDTKAIGFISQFGVASASQLAVAVYGGNKPQPQKSALRIARRRLSILAEHRLINRARSPSTSQYIYFSGRRPPERSEHALMLVDVYNAMLKLGGTISKWEREPDWHSLRPDAYCIYSYQGWRKHIAIEIERNTNSFNQSKYEALLAKWDKTQVFPKVLVVSDKPIKLEPSSVKYVVVPFSLKGIDQILK